MNTKKYSPYPVFRLDERTWPDKELTAPPLWCSVDLRDGNQALATPMTTRQKLDFFDFLVRMGFKEIEIGFPAASDTEYQFTRRLIEENRIPDDVIIQVLTQARPHIIERTFESLSGVKQAVVHLYNSTSTLQRDVVFGKSQDEILQIATDGAVLLNNYAEKYGAERFRFEYSPESFTGTEMDYAIAVCNAVLDVWQPTVKRKPIINLPATVEMTMPNVYADQVEYMCRNLKYRENIVVSLHTHNDRGTGIAATELALLAGADRVEGTLFGNGERTGNADILTLAMNLYSQGIDPGLDLSNVDAAIAIYESATGLPVHPRHPYAGELVYTAFSGSHQDAIRKGMQKMSARGGNWEVPYLPIDPADVGRSYDPIIRINSQSGKGGVAFILEQQFGLRIPKPMQQDFSQKVTDFSDTQNSDLLPQQLYDLFERVYLNPAAKVLLSHYTVSSNEDRTEGYTIEAQFESEGKTKDASGKGNGILSAFCNALIQVIPIKFEILDYAEHSLEHGKGSRAITYVQIADKDGKHWFGAGVSSSITKSSLKAVVNAVNQALRV